LNSFRNTMTRTARAAFPRAVIKDRSQSRSGLNKEMKKGGGGGHNWGKLGEVNDEDELEYGEYDSEGPTEISSTISDVSQPAPRKRSSSVPNEKEIEVAKQLRKHAFDTGVDLATIARTSVALSSSPPKATVPITSDANTGV